MPMSQLLFSFSGRLNRKPYWLTTLAMIAILIALILVVALMAGGVGVLTGGSGAGLGFFFIIMLILYLPFLWVGVALGIKRLHDRNKSGWWLLLFWVLPGILQGVGEQIGTAGVVLSLIGLGISIWGLVEMGFLRGTVGPNQYGPDPLEGHV
jgi:uncharacterized membrane protein YhaH (DUF805 family)